jgi:hypothetical protein
MFHCQPTATRMEMQERQATDRSTHLISHANDTHFILNMHAIHNAHLLRRVLPRELWRPVLLYPDQIVRHSAVAAKLRPLMQEKRQARSEKAAATRASKKLQQTSQPFAGLGPDGVNNDAEGDVRGRDGGEDGDQQEADEDESTGRKRQRAE